MSLNGLARLAPPQKIVGLAAPSPASDAVTKEYVDAAHGPAPAVGFGPFKCGYCGRYGQPGACEGCGAPNAPAPLARPDFLLRMHMTPNEIRTLEGLPRIPEFPMVKR